METASMSSLVHFLYIYVQYEDMYKSEPKNIIFLLLSQLTYGTQKGNVS